MARVLVVEDEDLTRALLDVRLTAAGHRVRAAASLAEARAVLAGTGAPDVVVTDMFMPGGSGLALVQALRADPAWADLPVIFVSGRALPADVDAGRALGAAYLTKPLSTAALTAAIDAALEGTPAAVEEAVRERLGVLTDDDSTEEREVLARLLTSFVDRAPEAVARVERALDAEDALALEAVAHQLAGAAATLGAGSLARFCADLEEQARAGEVPPAVPARAALQREVDVTCRVFEALAGELLAPAAEAVAGA